MDAPTSKRNLEESPSMASPTRPFATRSGYDWCCSLLFVASSLELLLQRKPEWQAGFNFYGFDETVTHPLESFKELDMFALKYEIGCLKFGARLAIDRAQFDILDEPRRWIENGLPIANL